MYCWGFPGAGRTAHIFSDGRSMCGKWMYFSADQPVEAGVIKPQATDCKACVRSLNKLRTLSERPMQPPAPAPA